MLKIKDNVDLKELEKFKYYEGTIMFQLEKKVFFKQIRRLFFHIEIVVYGKDRKIDIIKWVEGKDAYIPHYNFKGCEKYIKDIIKAGVVEKV